MSSGSGITIISHDSGASSGNLRWLDFDTECEIFMPSTHSPSFCITCVTHIITYIYFFQKRGVRRNVEQEEETSLFLFNFVPHLHFLSSGRMDGGSETQHPTGSSLNSLGTNSSSPYNFSIVYAWYYVQRTFSRGLISNQEFYIASTSTSCIMARDFFYVGLSPLFYAYFDCLAGMTWRQIGRYLGMGWYIASLSSSVQSAYNVFTADFYQKLDFFVEILLEWMHHFFHNTGIVCLLPQISQIFINFPTVYLKRRRGLRTSKINIALFVILLEGLW